MATVELFLEEKERGLYFVKIEVGFPMQRRKEFFANTGAEALRLAAEAFVEFGVDNRSRVKMMRPALQADIDRAQAAQEAAGDVTPPERVDAQTPMPPGWQGWASQNEMLGYSPGHDAASLDEMTVIDTPGYRGSAPDDPVKRKPGRPRKEA